MPDEREDTMSEKPVERFKPTSGRAVGIAGLAIIAFSIGYAVLGVQGVNGLLLMFGLVFFGVLVWVTQLRPRVTAYAEHLRMYNSVRDTIIPFALIDEVDVRQTLNVWVGMDRHSCIGIGKPMRALVRSKRPKGALPLLGFGRMNEYAAEADRPHPEESGMSYPDYVVMRVQDLVEKAKPNQDADSVRVRHVFAVPELVVLGLSGLGFVVIVLVG